MLTIEIIAPYLPGLVLRRCAGQPAGIGPAMSRIDAAVLFTDLSGFTRLAESLTRRDRGGAEELGRLLNACFEPLIEEIVGHGGDLAKMAGDALVAVWVVEAGETLAQATLRASQCALAVQARLSALEPAEGVSLSMRAGIAAGELRVMHVGGVLDRWEMLVAGEPLAQMSVAERSARPGDVVLSPTAWACAGDACRGVTLPDGCVRLASVLSPPTRGPIAAAAVTEESLPALSGYVPGAIRARLQAGQAGWLSEMRQVTVLFVQLPGLGEAGADALGRAQTLMRTLQEAVYGQEGSVNKLSVDDKGITLVAALGLPPLAHGDDPARGVLAGLAIRDAMGRLGEPCAIGITTGRAYCGEVGGRRRREYTMIGDVVNLAARLMQASSGEGNFLCDEATWRAARSLLGFEALPPIAVKGKADLIPVFRPVALVGRPRRARTCLAATGSGRCWVGPWTTCATVAAAW